MVIISMISVVIYKKQTQQTIARTEHIHMEDEGGRQRDSPLELVTDTWVAQTHNIDRF